MEKMEKKKLEKKKKGKKILIFFSMKLGVCYYPEHWPEERWEVDARMMRDAGIKVHRSLLSLSHPFCLFRRKRERERKEGGEKFTFFVFCSK